jgi:dTDP-4-dehydrorhamnose reductase
VKILITGANGQLGLALWRRLSVANSSHDVVALDRSSLDISNESACRAAVAKHAPDVVLNCAAYTAVDRAETQREVAFAINATGAANLAKCCADTGAFLIHFSTDYVFGGKGSRPYAEDDATAPLGVYGASKLAGEQAVQSLTNAFAILRLSWVYSNDGANFYKTMLRLAGERDTLRVVADQFGTPNFTGDLSDAVALMLSRPLDELHTKSGLYHLSAHGVTTWHEFASEIIATAPLARRPVVEAITTADFPTPALRPHYSALDSSRFAATFDWTIPDWRSGLARCVAQRTLSA